MRTIKVAAVQFETKDNDKETNFAKLEVLAERAAHQGAEIVSFHEACIPAYSWIQPLDKAQLLEIAEFVPEGPSVERLVKLATRLNVHLMAGLFEKDASGKIFNCYVTVGPQGFIAKFRKLHPFVNQHLSPGEDFCVIDLLGCKVGFLICYDNNLPENVRLTAMRGAEIIFMPHVTGCLPSVMPGRGSVAPELWDQRETDPARLRKEFRGPKGREWLMRWLPTRAYENGVYAVFTNPIGRDYNTIKPGLAMILDPYGEVVAESHELGDDVVVATLTPDKILNSSGQRYLKARRPELYSEMVTPQESVTQPGWELEREKDSQTW